MPRIMTIAIFLLIVSAILALGNIAVYEALRRAFELGGAESEALASVLAFFSASFIVSTIIGTRWYNAFTRIYYTVSAVWIGALLYFFLASVAYGLIAAAFPSVDGFGRLLFFAAIVVSMYAAVHARRIRIRRIAVTLPNLPSSWKNRTAAWVSDVHLGQIHGADLAKIIAQKIRSLSPDLIFVGGDLYDGTGAPDIAELTEPLRGLTAPLGTYFITGNHEEYGNLDRFLSAVRAVGMRVLINEIADVDGLLVAGVDYKDAADTERFKEIVGGFAIDRMRPAILLKHEPEDLEIAAQAGFALQISGHTHNAQLWPLTYLADLTYSGFAYGLRKLGDMQVYVSSGTGTWGPPMRLGTDSEIVLFTFI